MFERKPQLGMGSLAINAHLAFDELYVLLYGCEKASFFQQFVYH